MSTNSLFPVQLHGAGSSEVESLPSYIHRTAFEHGVYVGELIRYVHRNTFDHLDYDGIVDFPRYITVQELVRPSRTTNMISSQFEVSTGQDLRQSYLWILGKALGRSSKEIVDGFRWCPECFSETQSFGNEPYFKLIWHMASVSACPIHRTPLIDHCEYCGCRQITYKKRYPLGYCQECGVSLSKRKTRLRAANISHSWEDIGLDVMALFSELAGMGPTGFPQAGAKQSVDGLFDYYWRIGREEVLYSALSRDELLAVVYNQTPISLKTARRIAYRLGLSLYDFLSGNASQTTEVLDHDQFCVLPPGYLEANAKTKRDHRAILNKIKRYLHACATPPSLREVARQVDVSVGYLEHRYPVLVREIVDRHRDYEERQRVRKIHLAQDAALRFFLDEKYGDQPHSRKQAYRILREETGLPKFVLKRAIQSAYEAIS